MEATIKVYGEKRYLSITRPKGVAFGEFKRTRAELSLRFQRYTERVLSDCRAVDLESIRLIDADTLARDLRDDLPACRRIAIVTRSPGSRVLCHFQNVCLCHGIEARFFTDPRQARSWLCGEEEAKWEQVAANDCCCRRPLAARLRPGACRSA